jgi:hypothetical protein
MKSRLIIASLDYSAIGLLLSGCNYVRLAPRMIRRCCVDMPALGPARLVALLSIGASADLSESCEALESTL